MFYVAVSAYFKFGLFIIDVLYVPVMYSYVMCAVLLHLCRNKVYVKGEFFTCICWKLVVDASSYIISFQTYHFFILLWSVCCIQRKRLSSSNVMEPDSEGNGFQVRHNFDCPCCAHWFAKKYCDFDCCSLYD